MKSYFKQRTQKLFFGKLSQTLMMMPIITTVFLMFPGNLYAQTKTSYLLPDGKEYVSWEVPVTYSKTYYVDNGNPNASDNNEGTQEWPFLTVSKASEVLQPSERVVINSGVYREQVRPRRGGSAAEWRIVAGGGADYFKNTAAKNRKAGPFIDFPENDKTINIDPRVKL